MLIEEKNEDAEETLLFKYQKILSIVINKYAKTLTQYNISHEEVYQEVLISFFKAIEEFDEAKEAKFSTFINVCIRRKIMSIIKQHKTTKSLVNSNFSNLEDDFLILENKYLADKNNNHNPSYRTEQKEIINEKITNLEKNLSKKELLVWKYMKEGYKIIEIAKILKISEKDVYNTIWRIRKKSNTT